MKCVYQIGPTRRGDRKALCGKTVKAIHMGSGYCFQHVETVIFQGRTGEQLLSEA